jgi:GT2 family glycosyltransferase
VTTLAIVIVCHNALDDLARCLESLQQSRASSALDTTIVVVDNASTEQGLDVVAARSPDVQLIKLPDNRGFAAGTNVGIRATRSELVLLLNSDTIVGRGALDTLVSRLTAHPDAAAAGPRLVDAEGRTELSFGPMISPLGELRQKVTGALHRAGTPPVAAWVERRAREERYVDWVSGACLLVWRRDAEAVGLLDERYFLYTEDVDFCAALRARGRRVLFAPAAEITHLRGRSRRSAGSAMDAAYRRSHVAFYEKHHPAWAPVLRAYLRMKGVSGD